MPRRMCELRAHGIDAPLARMIVGGITAMPVIERRSRLAARQDGDNRMPVEDDDLAGGKANVWRTEASRAADCGRRKRRMDRGVGQVRHALAKAYECMVADDDLVCRSK